MMCKSCSSPELYFCHAFGVFIATGPMVHPWDGFCRAHQAAEAHRRPAIRPESKRDAGLVFPAIL